MNELRLLIDKLNFHTKLYNKGEEIISDEQWDELYFQLKEKEAELGIYYPDSPTQSITYETVSELKKIKHNHSMLSLPKTKNLEELENFIKDYDCIVMPKLDGLTCSLTYEKGELVRAETRGDGEEGEDILYNAKVVKNIPNRIDYKERLVLDGEVICTYKDFEQFKNDYKNPRNFAAGSIRLLDSKECSNRNLTFVVWDIIEGFEEWDYLHEKLEAATQCGFTCVNYAIFHNSLQEDIDYIINRNKGDNYPIDGIVVKYESKKIRNSLPKTNHHMGGAMAYKFYDNLYPTELIDIKWTMGRTGVLTPVAEFKPIEIDGTIVSKCSLFNVSVLEEKLEKPYIGQRVWVCKRNQIIPYIEKAEKAIGKNKQYIDLPQHCPICGKPIEYLTSEDGIINAYCVNPNCEGKFINRLEHFCGKKGLDIKGLSKATFQKLIDWGWLENLEQVFTLYEKKAEWIQKSGFGLTSVNKILSSIEEHKKTTLEAFISAIGIPLIGRATSKELSKYFKNYEEFRKAVDDADYDFSTLPNFGYEMNNSIKSFDFDEADKIYKLLFIEEVSQEQQEKNLNGQIIVITGKLNSFKNRNELKEIIESAGGKVTGSVSKKTTILINNDKDSNTAKNKTAKSLGIPILTEEEFNKKYLT